MLTDESIEAAYMKWLDDGGLDRALRNDEDGEEPSEVAAFKAGARAAKSIEAQPPAEPIPDDADPPPGWSRYTITDEEGCQHTSFHVRRDEPSIVTVQEAWAIHRREHGG